MILVLYNIILITNFKLIEMCIKSSPWRGLGRLSFRRLSFYIPREHFRLIQDINRSVIRQLDYINCEINVFQN